jgi:hypothetical protein
MFYIAVFELWPDSLTDTGSRRTTATACMCALVTMGALQHLIKDFE